MPDLKEFILPDTIEELMREKQQPQQVQATGSAQAKIVQNFYKGRGEK